MYSSAAKASLVELVSRLQVAQGQQGYLLPAEPWIQELTVSSLLVL